MALDAKQFHTQVNGAAQTHQYNTPDIGNTVGASGYFDGVVQRLHQWDPIVVTHTTGGTAATQVGHVSSATGATPVTTGGFSGT